MSKRRVRWTRAFLLLLASLATTQCLEGKPPPAVTEMVEITDGLTFEFGSEVLCFDESVAPQNRLYCGDVGESRPGRLKKIYPTMQVTLEPFAIDAHEVTNLQYLYCVAIRKCTGTAHTNSELHTDYVVNSAFENHPVVWVSQQQAAEYCASVGKRLPTEYEWERVAGGATEGGAKKRLYPFMDDPASPDDESASIDFCERGEGSDIGIFFCSRVKEPRPVGTSNLDRVDEGGGFVYDLAGNVSEWVLDTYDAEVTCESQFADCLDCFACDPQIDADCSLNCNNCPECQAAPNRCFSECAPGSDSDGDGVPESGAGPGLLGFPICFHYPDDTPRDCGIEGGASVCAGPPTGRVSFRGASYLTGEDGRDTCFIRSTERGQSLSNGVPNIKIGFRCAKDL